MLANYTFKDGVPKTLGDPGIPIIHCSIKRNYVKTALCDLGAGVSVMPFSLYRRLDLNKLTPTEVSLKMTPYAKYMKDIITNKRKIPGAEISTKLANYTFKGGVPKKLGDPGIPTIPCSIKRNYVKTALCDLGAGVSVMTFSLYKRLDLNKLTPTEISLQMADKSTVIPIGICEDVPIVVANVTILTHFVILEMPEDGNMSIIPGRPFLNT